MQRKIAILFAVVVLVLATLACGSSSTPEVNPPSNDTENAATEAPATEVQAAVGSARSNPAPFGYEVTVGDFTVSVTELVRPANDIVQQGNMFNPTPEANKEYVMVNVSIVCNLGADESCNITGFEFKLVGSAGQAHDPEIMVAGVAGRLEGGDFYGGATKSGYLVFLVDQGETDLTLIFQPLFAAEVYLSVEQ